MSNIKHLATDASGPKMGSNNNNQCYVIWLEHQIRPSNHPTVATATSQFYNFMIPFWESSFLFFFFIRNISSYASSTKELQIESKFQIHMKMKQLTFLLRPYNSHNILFDLISNVSSLILRLFSFSAASFALGVDVVFVFLFCAPKNWF